MAIGATPSSTSAIRSLVPSVVSGGSASTAKKPDFGDLAVRSRRAVLPIGPHRIDRDMVARRDVAVEKQAVQHRRAQSSIRPSSISSRRSASATFADLDAAARQMPARDIGVPDQEDAAGLVEHQSAHAQRHAAGKAPIQMKYPAQRRLQRPPRV